MPPKSYRWITAWFLFTAPIMFWDAGYCLMRPRSMAGGDLHWFWKPYEMYANIDYVYGVKAFENGEGFANAAAVLNLVEQFSNILYLLLVYYCKSNMAPLVGYTGATITLAKTVLYWSQEWFCSWCAVGHNSRSVIFWMWILPNMVWTIISALVVYRLGRDICSALVAKHRVD